MTTYERAIYHIITGSVVHPTVEQIFEAVRAQYPRIALATVYNNVNRLWKAGLIRKVAVANMPDRYDRLTRHDHLVCRQCGRLEDISFSDLTASLRRQWDGEILSYDLKVYYLCPDCRARAAASEQTYQKPE